MRFVLRYSGLLPSSGNRPKREDKHDIRKRFHPQLKRQWEVEPSLSQMPTLSEAVHKAEASLPGELSFPRGLEITRGSFCCIPLVTKHLHLVCSLDITMLRPEEPGKLIRSGGDIDGRMKTLLDSLSVPVNDDEVAGFSPEDGEKPFYCLLEDDSLVTSLQVRTERLLVAPPTPEKPISEVELLVAVVVRPTRVTKANIWLLGGWLS